MTETEIQTGLQQLEAIRDGEVSPAPIQEVLDFDLVDVIRSTVARVAKSTHRERIEENARIFDFTLSDSDVAALDALDRTGGTHRAREDKWW